MSLERLIDQTRGAETILGALGAGRRLRREAARAERPRAAARLLLARCGEDADGLSQLLLIRALARVEGSVADDAFVAMLGDGDAGIRGHAAWALAERSPVPAALPGLLRMAASGGFETMLAQLAVELWGAQIPHQAFRLLAGALPWVDDPRRRERLVETLTLVDGPAVQEALLSVIGDSGEMDAVRAAAVRGLDPSFADPEPLIAALESADSGLRQAASFALSDLRDLGDLRARQVLDAVSGSDAIPAMRPVAGSERSGGLRVAQIVLQGRVDAELAGAGAGDSGGLATLLVGLGRALGRRPEIEHAFTVARGFGGAGVSETYARPAPMGAGASLVRVPFGPERDLGAAEMWRYRLQIERGLERLFERLGPLDAVHLRFADAGTLAARRVARRLGIPVFFSLAPDPHSVIRAAEAAGTLSRRDFAAADRREYLLFRAELVESMARDAHRLALFPRPALERELRELMDVDVAAERGRFWTVPEGIDTALPDRAAGEVAATEESGPTTPEPRLPVLAELAGRIEALGAERRGLPLLVGLGRLHPVKGFHRLARAWAGDPELRQSFNLLLVGGDLERPSAVESRVLERIEDTLRQVPEARRGLIFFGRRSNLDAARLLAAARRGHGPQIGAGGVFVCASDKEEFGLAILEAMAAGLAVVAPDAGGPATYVRDGVNGFLARTTSVPRLRAAIHRAAAAADCPQRTARARRLVRERFTVDAMAGALARMYRLPSEQTLESAA